MLIGNYTGATFYDNIRNQKSYSGLLMYVNVSTTDTLNTIKLSTIISKKNGSNEILINKQPLVDLFLLSSLGKFNTVKEANNTYIGYVDLSLDGNIELSDGDEIISSLEGTQADDQIKIYGFEEPTSSTIVKKYEIKPLLSEFTNIVLNNLDDYEALTIDNINTVTSIVVGYDNGKFVTYQKDELFYIARDTDFFSLITQTATTSQIQTEWLNRLVLPMVGVKSIEVNKLVGTAINCNFIKNAFLY
jgi:hypothetical protein